MTPTSFAMTTLTARRALLLALVLFGLPAMAQTPIRVGVTPQPGLFTLQPDGTPAGYHAEYLRKLAEYAGWELNFITVSQSQGLNLLAASQIDLLCQVTPTPARRQQFAFPPIASGSLPISVMLDAGQRKLDPFQPHLWKDINVGFTRTREPVMPGFRNFAQSHGFAYTPRAYETCAALFAALSQGEIDCAVGGVAQVPAEVQIITQLQPRPFHCVVNRRQAELYQVLCQAVEKIKIYDQDFLDSLNERHLTPARPDQAKQPAKRRVRVGYYLAAGLHDLDHHGVRSGYCNDYLERIAALQNWEIEPIDVTLERAIQYLGEGKLDVVAGLAKNSEREQTLAFTSLPQGIYCASLITLKTNDRLRQNDFQSWNGARIGMQRGNHDNTLFLRTMRRHRVNTTQILFDDTIQAEHAMAAGECDAVLTTAQQHDRHRLLAKFEPYPIYFCTGRDNPLILEELNNALTILKLSTPDFEPSLHNRHFPADSRELALFTAEEQALLATLRSSKLRVEIADSLSPLTRFDPTSGELSSFSASLLQIISAKTGLEFDILPPGGISLAIERLRQGDADCWLGFTSNALPILKAGETGDYIKLPQLYVYPPGYRDEPRTKPRLAINKHDIYLHRHVAENHRNWQLIPYPDEIACFDAVLARKADFTISNIYTAKKIINDSNRFAALVTRPIDLEHAYYPFRFVFSQHVHPKLIAIFNKCLESTSPEEIRDLLFEATISEMKPPLITPITAAFATLSLVLVIMLTIILVLNEERIKNARRTTESQATLSAILDTIPHGVYWKDRQGVYLGCNRKFAADVGLASITAVVGKTDYDLPWQPQEADSIVADDIDVILANRPLLNHCETMHFSHDRTAIIETSKLPMAPDSHGQPQIVLGIYEDITQRKKMEEIERFNRLMVGRETRILELKARVNQLSASLGLTPPFPSLLQEPGCSQTPTEADEDTNPGTPANNFAGSNDFADSQRRAILSLAEEAQAAAKAKSMFLATMSHEIRTPLNAVIGFSELLKNRNLSETEVQDYLDNIAQAGKALLGLVNSVLDFSKLEAGYHDMAEGQCQLPRLFAEMEAIFQQKAQEKGLQLQLDISDTFPPLSLNEQRMRQILINLLSNAVKFTDQGKVCCHATIHRREDQTGDLKLIVQDTGIGIPPEQVDSIFAPFIRHNDLQSGGKTFEGTGLGLAIVKKLLEQIGGTISCLSTPQQGTTFVVELPQVRVCPIAEPLPPPPGHGDRPGTLPARILLVDDIKVNLKVLAGYLKRLGVDSRCALSGHEALQILAGYQPDLVITDLWMQGMNGAELAQAIHAIPDHDTIPIVAVTADIEMSSHFDVSHFAGVLYKPVSEDKLLALLKTR